MVPQSQIGFIDFIVVPTLGIAGDAMSLVLCSRQENKEIQKPWNEILLVNKSKWQAKVSLVKFNCLYVLIKYDIIICIIKL